MDGARPHIMLFDSSQLIRQLMDALLTEEHDRVTVSTFLPTAFEQIAAVQPALLIIDLAFHQRVGWELLEQLARDALTRNIPVLMTSTDASLLERAEANQVRYGGQSWIAKPFELEVIMDEVRRLTAPT